MILRRGGRLKLKFWKQSAKYMLENLLNVEKRKKAQRSLVKK
jgi:hypothetical protein